MFRLRIGHFMALIAVVAPFLLGVRVLLERGTGAESIGRKMMASFFLAIGIIVISCFVVAYMRGSPEERKKLFSPPPESAELLAEIGEHLGKVVGMIRRWFRR